MADDNDDLLDPAEIEELLNEAGAADTPSPPPKKPAPETTEAADAGSPAEEGGDGGDHLSQDELDRLMGEAQQGTAPIEQAASAPEAASTAQAEGDDVGASDLLDPNDIAQLLNAHNTDESPPAQRQQQHRRLQRPPAQSNCSNRRKPDWPPRLLLTGVVP